MGKYLVVALAVVGLGAVSCASTNSQSKVVIEQLQSQAAQGDRTAQRRLGAIYDGGQGVARDLAEAAKWYSKAAEQGDVIAQNSLGSLYQSGEGVAKDYEKAAYWYKRSAEGGNAQAQNSLAYMYDLGLGMKQDLMEARRLYQLSAGQGWLEAMLNLGILNGQGKGEPANYIEAYKWLDLARSYTQNAPSTNPVKWRARGALDEVKAKMTPAQIQQAEKLVRDWDESHRKP